MQQSTGLSKRIQKEITAAKECSEYEFFYDESGLLGQEGCCYLRFLVKQGVYAEQKHIIRISFTYGNSGHIYRFPANAPSVKFETPVWHPNISLAGSICLDILQDKWSPMFGINVIYNTLLLLLESPNPNSPLNAEAGRQLRDSEAYKEKAKLTYHNNMSARAEQLLIMEF